MLVRKYLSSLSHTLSQGEGSDREVDCPEFLSDVLDEPVQVSKSNSTRAESLARGSFSNTDPVLIFHPQRVVYLLQTLVVYSQTSRPSSGHLLV